MWQHGWAVCTAHKELCHIGSNIVLSSAILSSVCSALSLSQQAGNWFSLAINHDPSHYWRGNTMWGGGGRQKRRRRTGNCRTRSVFERFVFWYCRSETQLDARGSGGNEKELVVELLPSAVPRETGTLLLVKAFSLIQKAQSSRGFLCLSTVFSVSLWLFFFLQVPKQEERNGSLSFHFHSPTEPPT